MKVWLLVCMIGVTLPLRRVLSYCGFRQVGIRGFPLYSSVTSLSFFGTPEFEDKDDDLSKWERMYEAGEEEERQRRMSEEESWRSVVVSSSSSSVNSEVRVVTFDLDNTLWKTKEVIGSANDVLAAYLESSEQVRYIPKRVEVIMGELFEQNRRRYAPKDPENASYATLLTLLRKDAIAHLLTEYNAFSSHQAQTFADYAFQIWTQARHDAIPNYFANSVIPTLQQIRNMHTTHPVIIGAITDGNSDPTTLPLLQPYFDFCINSEKVGTSKPDKDVYLAAIPQFAHQPHLQQTIFQNTDIQNLDQLLDLIGPWWVHIGDDFLKDIVGANSLNIRTIWCRELILDKLLLAQTNNSNNNNNNDKPKEEQQTLSEFMQRVAQNGNQLTMSIGTEDFLTESIHTEFADAIIDNFQDIPSILSQWNTIQQEPIIQVDDDTKLPIPEEEPVNGAPSSQDTPSKNDPFLQTKFCISCGTKLPSVAQFCSSCGTKQQF